MPGKIPTDLKVMVVDPVPAMAQLATGMLRAIGVRKIQETNTAAATMKDLTHREFDVLLLDDSLKDVDAVKFVSQLRACAECTNRDIPIIMMAAAPGAKRIASARDAGVTEFLRKPFAPTHLEQRLLSILAAPREFITAETYAGPDRRRRTAPHDGEDRRSGRPPEGDASSSEDEAASARKAAEG